MIGGWHLWYLWLSLNILVLALGYAFPGRNIFRKRPDGTIPIVEKIVFLPFFCYTLIVWHLARKLIRENPFDRVENDLIIGRRLLPSEVPSGIRNYVDLTVEFEEPVGIRSSLNYLCLPILNGSTPTLPSLKAVLKRVAVGPTYIHCARGHGRTCLFALALMAERGCLKSYEDGMARLKAARPGVRLNAYQEPFTREFVRQCLERPGPDLRHDTTGCQGES